MYLYYFGLDFLQAMVERQNHRLVGPDPYGLGVRVVFLNYVSANCSYFFNCVQLDFHLFSR